MKKLLLVLICSVSLTGCITTSTDNEHIGNIVKIKHSGWLCPTWEVELIRLRTFANGAFNANITTGKEEYFTVPSLADLKLLKEAMENQKEIKIISHHEAIHFCTSNHGEFIDNVEFKE